MMCKLAGKQEARGCVSPVEFSLWSIPYCPICGSKEEKCMLCKGKGEIPVYRCPRSADLSLLPFFYPYQNSGGLAWPDGRGRLYQPRKLIMAFDILMGHFQRHKNNGC
jgi:hypothetical protein